MWHQPKPIDVLLRDQQNSADSTSRPHVATVRFREGCAKDGDHLLQSRAWSLHSERLRSLPHAGRSPDRDDRGPAL